MARTHYGYRGYNAYIAGDAWFICDVCSQRWRRSQMFVRWDNLRVDAACNDPRPPELTVPNVYPEGLPFPDARPPQDMDTCLQDNTVLPITGANLELNPGALAPLYFDPVPQDPDLPDDENLLEVDPATEGLPPPEYP